MSLCLKECSLPEMHKSWVLIKRLVLALSAKYSFTPKKRICTRTAYFTNKLGCVKLVFKSWPCGLDVLRHVWLSSGFGWLVNY